MRWTFGLWLRFLKVVVCVAPLLLPIVAHAQQPGAEPATGAALQAAPHPPATALPAQVTVDPVTGKPGEAARTRGGDLPLGGEALRRRAALPPLQLPPRMARYGWPHLAITGAFGAAALGGAMIAPIESHRRQGGTLFDNDVRELLRARSTAGQLVARDTSDALLSLATTYPFFVDAMLTAWWFRGNADAARQMSLIGLEAMAITAGIQGVTNTLMARERPYGQECGVGIPADAYNCTGAIRYRSFFSGHAAQAFTAAGVICTNHFQLKLLGRGPGDAITCLAGIGVAGAVATLRVVGDMHYASDVLIGSSVGALIGVGVPLLHYHGGVPTLALGKDGASVSIVPSGAGVGLMGSF